MEEENLRSALYRPHMGAESQSLGGETVRTVELSNIDQSERIHEMDDSQLVGVPVIVAADSVVGVDVTAASAVDVEVKAEVMVREGGIVKRKRGRPPRGQAKPQPLKKKKEEEDVCFICFDGGSLVLCDRRGCPKAYHPTCIKRDAAFFRSRARWNCGWHICSVCQKAAHYMCYTCTYSLCKGCTKDADYLCVRGDKGFCTTCMRTVMLIENNEQGNKEMGQVDFDDKSSWEYLFKVYWIYLKGKLSLTLTELAQAKNPWKGAGAMACKGRSSGVHYGTSDGKCSILDRSSGTLEANISKRRKTKEQLKLLNTDTLSMETPSSEKGTSLIGCPEWATKELLEFIAHMKNGDTSILSQFDVQALLLDYIKRNNLRDPHRKSQIICDLMLKNLFGKTRVGHFEMLKLLEFHFLIKEESQKDVFLHAGVVDPVASQVEADANNNNLLMVGKDKKRKTRRKGEERAPQTNLDEYAAIDVHNINLIYLRRNLMETLIEDTEKFHDKVVGSIVRIRISSSDQKHDMYRLVQVVGTSKVAVPYKIGNRTADVILEVLNLDKKETISIDAISNQEFYEDECRRLRQSIRCGLVKRSTVGEIQEKAMALQAVRLNDWLETEILRLNHLRDRASEKGHKKELRECVEKLKLLKTPEEHQRRLREIPQVHSDPNMDPDYESEEDAGECNDKKQGAYVRPRYSGFGLKGSKLLSPQKRGDTSNDSGSRAWRNSTTSERSRNMCITFYPDKDEGHTKALERINEGKDACGSNSSERPGSEVDSTSSAIGGWNNQAVVRSASFAGIASETSMAPLSMGNTPCDNNCETDKLWHYRDPNGKIQGPFSMVQLEKWSTTGYFPPDMRIWPNDRQDDSLLLSDVLDGQFHEDSPQPYNIPLQSQEVGGASDGRFLQYDVGCSENMNATGRDGKQSEGFWHRSNARAPFNGNIEFVRSDGLGSHSSDQTAPVVSYKEEIQAGSCSQHQDSCKGDTSSYDQSQLHSPPLSSMISGRPYVTLLHHGRDQEVETWNSGPNHEIWNSHGTRVFQITGGHENQSNSQGFSGQSSGQNWRPFSAIFPSNDLDSNSSLTSVTKSTDSSEQKGEVDIPNLDSPTPKTSNGDWEGQAAENKHSVSSSVPVQHSDLPYLPSPTPKTSNEDQKGQAAENKQSVTSKFPVQDSGPSWGSASSRVVGGAQLREIADECGGYSPTPVKPSVEEWDSGLVSVSSLKPPEAGDHVASPTSKNDQFTHSSPSHPASNISSWQTVVTEPFEFSTLAEESVSDLLAEVDAMESRSGLASPTSVMKCGGYFIHCSKNDCFSPIEEFSPTPDPGKSDAFSSTGDIHLPCQSVMTDEPVGASQADVFDPVKRSIGQSSVSAEVDRGSKSTDVPVIQGDAGSDMQPPAPFTVTQGVVDRDIAQRVGLEATAIGWGTKQQSSTRAEVEGETKSTDVPSNQEVSDIQSAASFMRQDMVDMNVACGSCSEARDTGWGTMQLSPTRAEVEGETKSTDVPGNQEGSNIQPPAPVTMRQDMIDTHIARGAGPEPMVVSWGTMQHLSTRAEVEGKTKSTDVPGNQEDSNIQPPAPVIMKQDMVDTDISQGLGSEAMIIGLGTMQQSSTRAEVEGERKFTDVPGNHEGSEIQPLAPFTVRQEMTNMDISQRAGSESMDTMMQDVVDMDIASRARSEAMVIGWGAMKQSSTRHEVEGETKSIDVRVNQKEAGSNIQPLAPFIMGQDIDTNIVRRAGSEAMGSGWGTMQGNVNLGWGRSAQGITNMGRGTSQGISRGNANMNSGTLAGSQGWESQHKYGGERFDGPRAFQGGGSGFSRGRPSWSWQSFGGAGGGGYSRPPPKGQRVCKFYASGYCKKGASCEYQHP